MKFHGLFVVLITAFALTSCGGSERADDLDYVPLKDYSFQPTDLDSGTTFKLLAFSGGKSDDKDNVYYYQFIGVNTTTKDTMRILAPLISFPSEENPTQKIHTTPLQIDASKRISEATYSKADSMTNLMLQTFSIAGDANSDQKAKLEAMKNGVNSDIKAHQWVVVNKGMPIFSNTSYKTAIGILHFSERPW